MGLCHYWCYYWGIGVLRCDVLGYYTLKRVMVILRFKCLIWCLLLNEDEVEVKVNVKGVPSYQLE